MVEIGTEVLTSAVIPMAIVSSVWLRATGRPGAAVAAPNVAQRRSKAIKLDINAHIALAWPQPIGGVPGASINPVFCNMCSTAGVLLKGRCLSRPAAMCCKDWVQIKKAGRTCFRVPLMLTSSGHQLLLGPAEDLRLQPCCYPHPPNS